MPWSFRRRLARASGVPDFVDAIPGPDGWTAWDDRKNGTRWQMQCCDCGLIHEVEMQAGMRLETEPPKFAPIEGAYAGIRMRRVD